MSESIYNGIKKFDISRTKIIPDNAYDGVVLNKMTVYDGNKFYLIKGRSENQRKFLDFDGKTIISLNNSIISEHISSKIINLISMDGDTKAHNTMLVDFGGYPYVACEHFIHNNGGDKVITNINGMVIKRLQLHDKIEKLDRQMINELDNILRTINTQNDVDKDKLLRRFWNQFALDALLLNWDRHGGNWSLIYDRKLNTYELAPIYDQGSTLMSKLDSNALSFDSDFQFNSYQRAFVINVDNLENSNEEEYKNIIERVKTGVFETSSAIHIDGHRIKYYDFIKSTDNKDFFKSIKLLVDKINMQKIFKLIEEELSFSKKYQDFYKLLISLSYNEIILKGLKENKHYQRWLKESNNKEDITSE